MTNEEITKLLSDHVARRASGKHFTDEEYEAAWSYTDFLEVPL